MGACSPPHLTDRYTGHTPRHDVAGLPLVVVLLLVLLAVALPALGLLAGAGLIVSGRTRQGALVLAVSVVSFGGWLLWLV
ncbi:hypothetical protein NOK12_17950 [Nocardioides sp. OK12]|nr:hypothetical protein NOK12_17950 [Nocardioides sp. OK12]